MRIEFVATNIEARCEQILRSLPLWFGQEGAIVEYIGDTSRLPTFAAVQGEEVSGFLTLRQHSPQSFETSCLAVHALDRRRGAGRHARMGFVPLEVFPTLWSVKHPCLQLIKRLGK